MKRRTVIQMLPLVALTVLGGCASGGGGSSSGGGSGGAVGNRNLITATEVAELPPGSALDVIRRLRSQWLADRGMGTPSVAVDGRLQGGVESLHSIQTDEIQEIRFRAARDATTRYGTGHPAGIIEVTTRR